MRFDDLRKLATGSVLFNLGRIISPRLVTILYLLGLAAIALWAVNHFFASFRFGFGNGLWGLLEIAVFGLLAFVALRIACEGIIVFFRANSAEAETYEPEHMGTSLIDDVREAIEDLADQEPDPVEPVAPPPVAPTPPAPTTPVAEEPAVMPDADAPKPAAKRRASPRKPASKT
ncbi:DUF4282 domain-containing protein [Pelagibacterium halotolerans]|uniref:DUF4282 domain-containing protein n=1 Tax=Pelagibacterium halotolerans (strain DSM 22347 / JCM 15775 / CGMCC 1.7692 / B2) TaxID=1082931 RepID=G4RC02_PELHB|nr:DUF4282 domain-containing protein [Pelagibacterium halotolerans]AEQ51650.1 hypothetical protein KKY_1634 [Pelagibacterium halotolerans B2]QJR18523.1 DUF4282 domain-containing protein [Pelagibacterium halotolerans]SEA19171.1 protein of unknown function [Pelagibacterium halotolerans]